jgi:hypothetical protein
MSPLVKKEIHLLLPARIVALMLAVVAVPTYEIYGLTGLCPLWFGLTLLALSSFGREFQLGTFSSYLAQPAPRTHLWRIKIGVLFAGMALVFVFWLLLLMANHLVHAYLEAPDYFWKSPGNFLWTLIRFHASETGWSSLMRGGAGTVFFLATFATALWSTLLLRQVAAALWITLLVPVTLFAWVAVSMVKYSDAVLALALCAVAAPLFLVGFWWARRLFFRAQDVGWSGGVISLPDWPFSAALPENVISPRNRKPIFALMKKEFQLQQVSLIGAVGLLALHIGIIALRKYHQFAKDSAGEVVTCIFWILWLVMPVIIGCMAVAEERRLGVMEGQLCQPASRRIQFGIKSFVILFLGILLGGVMPMLLEAIGVAFGARNPAFLSENHTVEFGLSVFALGTVAFSTWLALVSFFASSLAKNFLQAVGYAIATFICLTMILPALADERIRFYGSISLHFILLLVIAIPIITTTLLWLAYLNYKNFRDGWPLWQRNLLGLTGAVVFALVSSTAIYNRAWEVFEPAEPPHGTPKFSLANPPTLQIVQYRNLLVRLPDGRVWFDCLGDPYNDYGDLVGWQFLWRTVTHPLRESAGPQQFLAGSNWVAATTERLYFGWNVSGKQFFASGFMDTVGIQPDGTLWISENPEPNKWTAGTLQRFGSETNWRQLAQSRTSIVLLKSDGTLWRWGSVTNELHQWPGLRAFTLYQIGTNSDWQELFTLGGIFARRTDGRVWHLNVNWKTGRDELDRATNYDEIVSQTASHVGDQQTAFVRADGTLWVLNRYWDEKTRQTMGTGILQVGKENNWRAVADNYGMMVALKSDGSLWQWHFFNPWNMSQGQFILAAQKPPTRLGIHNDWVAIANTWEDVIALAADGSLWVWPSREQYERFTLLKLPKQPQLLGNVFSKAE